ncbi:alanine/glycine:cation symporter family protein [Velocimicrobium porci]|uniref:Sodium:alanine symporter family protein n=1 Tax=Velocimicrobium porci TaxID=2606634 RepID=A0A6L5XYR2_9FIRM|nr:amino acid carrier protein [Velocimicrobium porci]MSS63834.1 sodium:alanine symporter family protein [Velocimicrobium porci]
MLNFFRSLNSILWGIPLLVTLLGTHLFFTLHLGFVQKKTFHAIKLSITPEENNSNGLSGFGVLATTLAATLGTGNIVGVSTAIFFGGAGAVFWCWLTGILGMATSYGECYLSMRYRRKTSSNTYYGGPMYVLEDGLHKKGLARFYSFCVLLSSIGVGCTTQSNSIAETVTYLWNFSPTIIGILASVLVGLVIIGGFSSIESFCIKLVPSMGFLYLAGCMILLIINYKFLPASITIILKQAFSLKAAGSGIAGGILNASIKAAARYGIARGLFTNEAGIGSAAIAAAGSHTENIERQALISMTATFWDTVVMCAITGLVIISNILRYPESVIGMSGGNLTHAAFESIPYIGAPLLGVCLILFAFATLIGWSYFGQQAFLYLFPKKHLGIYQTFYLVMIFLGAVLSLDLVWEITDTINFFMVIPNLISLYALKHEIKPPCT